jgi:hypothetical protein
VAIRATKRGVRWLAEQPNTYDLGLAFFTAIVGFSSAADQYGRGNIGLASLLALATAAALVLNFVKGAVSLAALRRKESPHELEGCLHTLHSVLLSSWEAEGKLRIALHVPVGQGLLEQVTEYIGDTPKPGRVGRRFPANAGIIGRAFRENDNFVSQRENDNYEEYVKELVESWNYTEDLARLLNPAVMSWMAVPFHDPVRRKVEGILYLDSTNRDFFTDERQALILRAAAGIAVFIGRRYT